MTPELTDEQIKLRESVIDEYVANSDAIKRRGGDIHDRIEALLCYWEALKAAGLVTPSDEANVVKFNTLLAAVVDERIAERAAA